jgi:biotin-(acetyl-CoA carboxylase) ligase
MRGMEMGVVTEGFSGDAEAWLEALAPVLGGGTLHLLGTTDSTNLRLRALAAEGAPPFTVVVADAQREGRGREGRRWDSLAGTGLWISVLLPPPPGGPPGVAPLAVGVALAEAVEEVLADGVLTGVLLAAGVPEGGVPAGEVPGVRTEVSVGLKWPNDLLLRREGSPWGKCAGILCEVAPGGGIVAGVGVNLRGPVMGGGREGEGESGEPGEEPGDGAGAPGPPGPHPLPRAWLFPAVPGAREASDIPEFDLLRRGLARALLRALRRWADPPPDRMTPSLRRAWEARDVLLGEEVQIHPEPAGPGGAGGGAGGSRDPWRVEGVSAEGALLVRRRRAPGGRDGGGEAEPGSEAEDGGEAGELRTVRAGRVRLLGEGPAFARSGTLRSGTMNPGRGRGER